MTERVYGEIDHTGYCKRCPDRTRCFVNEGCVQDAHEKKQADARALWAVRVLDRAEVKPYGCRYSWAWADGGAVVSLLVTYPSGRGRAFEGAARMAARIAAAEALVAEDPSLGEGL